ncbi:multiprotein-bridging factor 1 family protein [Dactylosporangium siamense]|uniref:helix-turn-helix domain-containing protein n=1 Tax=Dactylosporangium siamense TaxID=685454 RepID=UPI0019452A3D|nr:helix-turn-helix transcriptional regulator [Dactylosporangium siamense]
MNEDRREEAKRIGQLIRAARKRKRLSQYRLNLRLQELGQMHGVGSASQDSIKTEISRWENGWRIPDQRSRRLLGIALDVRPEDLGLPLDPLDDWPSRPVAGGPRPNHQRSAASDPRASTSRVA